MTEEQILKQMKFIRDLTLNAVEEVDHSLADVTPEGFRNTIRWNIGHIITSQELLISKFTGLQAMELPVNYEEMFSPGTKPSTWSQGAPSLEELERLLKKQPKCIEKRLSGRLHEKVKRPFKVGAHGELTTIGEILNFTLYHEGLHQGYINALRRALDADSTVTNQ